MKTLSDRFVSHASWQTVVSHRLTCEHIDPKTRAVRERGWGFVFDCDASGKVNESAMNPRALENYRGCVDGSIPVTPLTLQTSESEEKIPAVIRCDCDRRLTLWDSWANACECGREFNGSGQLLAPRSQWGEETGEEGTF